jgi:hypothetical protein
MSSGSCLFNITCSNQELEMVNVVWHFQIAKSLVRYLTLRATTSILVPHPQNFDRQTIQRKHTSIPLLAWQKHTEQR